MKRARHRRATRSGFALLTFVATVSCPDDAPQPPRVGEPVRVEVGAAADLDAPLRLDLTRPEEVARWELRNGIVGAEETPGGLRIETTGGDPYLSRELSPARPLLGQVRIETAEPMSGDFVVYLKIGGRESETYSVPAHREAAGGVVQVADLGALSWSYGEVEGIRLDPPTADRAFTLVSVTAEALPAEGRYGVGNEVRPCTLAQRVRVPVTGSGRHRLLASFAVGADAVRGRAAAELSVERVDAGTGVRSPSRHRIRLGEPAWREVLLDVESAGRSTALEMVLRDEDGEPLVGCFARPVLLPDPGASPTRPNVLLLVLDTLRGDRLDFAPYLRSLAEEGRSFDRMWASSNWTLPSHVSLFTSTPVLEHGVPSPGLRAPFLGSAVPARLPVLAESLLDAGYATGATTDGGFAGSAYGLARGFERYASASHPQIRGPDTFAHHEAFADDFVGLRAGRPFFLFVHTFKVHDYFLNTPDYHDFVDAEGDASQLARGNLLDAIKSGEASRDYVERLYAAGVRRADEFVERFVDRVRALTADAPLLVVVTSDHGESFGHHDDVWHHGTSMLEEQIRVPLIVWGNFEGAPTGVVRAATSTLDLAPSLLAFLGVDVPTSFRGERDRLASPPPAGRSGAVLASTPQSARRLALRRFDQAVVDGGWKYLRSDSFLGRTLAESCYDLDADPGESHDLAGTAADGCDPLRGLYADLLLRRQSGALLVQSSARTRFRLEQVPGDFVAVRTATRSSSDVARIEEGVVDWQPGGPRDVLAVLLEAKPALAALEAGGAPLAARVPPAELGSEVAPRIFESTAGGGAATAVRLFTRGLPEPGAPAAPAAAAPLVRSELVEQLRALGYATED